MSRYEDAHLWEAYAAATTDEERRRIAGEILTLHMPFFHSFAHETAGPGWSDELREEYLQELLAVAVERIPTYQVKAATGERQMFVSYLAPYLRPVRYRIYGQRGLFAVGIETARIITAVDGLAAEGITDPEVIAAHVSKIHGKRITPRRVAGILARPQSLRGDLEARDLGSGPRHRTESLWSIITDPTAGSVEDEAIERAEGSVSLEVTTRLAQLDLTELEVAIVTERLMAQGTASDGTEGVTTTRVLGKRFGVTSQAVSKAEARLAERLRGLLGDLAA